MGACCLRKIHSSRDQVGCRRAFFSSLHGTTCTKEQNVRSEAVYPGRRDFRIACDTGQSISRRQRGKVDRGWAARGRFVISTQLTTPSRGSRLGVAHVIIMLLRMWGSRRDSAATKRTDTAPSEALSAEENNSQDIPVRHVFFLR